MSPLRPPRACRAARERLALHYYAALDAAEEETLERHLGSCPACAREWDLVKRALDALDPRAIAPLEPTVDWGEFARSTASRARAAAARERPVLRRGPWGIPAAARLTALAAVLAAALLALSAWLRTRTEAPAPVDGEPPVTMLESAHIIEDRLGHQGAARYLRDSRALLLNLVGPAAPCRKSDGHYDITLEKEKSRQLLRRKNLYDGDLLTLEDRRLATLVAQLESVLMEVTTLDDCATARQIHDLRERIETREILLRIDLMTREMQRREHVV
ncbi:MAG TPA: hypothetical protein VKF61_04905 [Candidatus Polarisedimenticolia bacterium]|nr:hypothetical protein [Candidatus Polarisedimenticolia bacterium]